MAKKKRQIRTAQAKQLARLNRPKHHRNPGSHRLPESEMIPAFLRVANALLDLFVAPPPPYTGPKPKGLINDLKTIDLAPDHTGVFGTANGNHAEAEPNAGGK